jgi:hypothetical protein
MKACLGCGKEVEPYLNFCSWECHIDLTKREGGKVHCPNGLPIRCITRDGLMIECEHGDHPDYKFPVVAQYVGSDPNKFKDEHHDSSTELHALIYTDGVVALTIYECCYTLWSVSDGSVLREHLWYKKGEWRLNLLSLTQIQEFAKGKTT